MIMYANITYRRGEDAKSVRNVQSNIAVTNKHTAKLHHVGSLYILTYDARKLKHKKLKKYLAGKKFDDDDEVHV